MEFLKKYLDIDSLESVLFVTHKTEWAKSKNNLAKSEFWGSRDYVLNDSETYIQKIALK